MDEHIHGALRLDEDRFGRDARRMVERQLRPGGIVDPRVLRQMRSVPRHHFVNPNDQHRAYDDGALPTVHGQTISQPYIVALMSQMLQVNAVDRVLEIGTGTGYQTMILAGLAAHVVSVERDEDLAERARRMMKQFDLVNVTVHTGDGTLGWPEEGPYDRILVTAAAPDVPPPLREQLADGGRMVIPTGDRAVQRLTIVERQGDDYRRINGLDVRFVPLVGEAGWSD